MSARSSHSRQSSETVDFTHNQQWYFLCPANSEPSNAPIPAPETAPECIETAPECIETAPECIETAPIKADKVAPKTEKAPLARRGKTALRSNVAKLPRHLDRRIKLSETQKDAIRALYKDGKGIREIAREYEGICSRRLIQLVLFPERAETLAKQLKARKKEGKHKPTKEEWARTMREHRAYKKLVLSDKTNPTRAPW